MIMLCKKTMEKVSCTIFTLFVVICFIPSSVPISDSYRNYHQDLVYPLESFISVTLKTPKPPFLKYDFFDKSNEQSPPMYPLFTPNTINQRPETAGQIEEYNKALAEEKEEKEDEVTFPEYKKLNSIPHSTQYVNVRGGTYNYKYAV